MLLIYASRSKSSSRACALVLEVLSVNSTAYCISRRHVVIIHSDQSWRSLPVAIWLRPSLLYCICEVVCPLFSFLMCYAAGFSRASITVKVPCLLRVKYIFKIFSPASLLPLLPSLAFPSLARRSCPSHYPRHKLKCLVRPYRWQTLCAGGVFGVPCLPCLPGL